MFRYINVHVHLFGIFEEVSARMHGTGNVRGEENFKRNFRKLKKNT